jgi:hypothetical protein
MSGPDIPCRYCSDLPPPRRGVLSGKSSRTSRRWRLFLVRFVWAFLNRAVEVLRHLTSLMRSGQYGNARHTDLIFSLACLGNVVRRLHTHQRVHLYSRGFLDAERHIPGKVPIIS